MLEHGQLIDEDLSISKFSSKGSDEVPLTTQSM